MPVGKRASVVECGGPPPLFRRQTSAPMLSETAIAMGHEDFLYFGQALAKAGLNTLSLSRNEAKSQKDRIPSAPSAHC